MQLSELFRLVEDESEHWAALKKTGYYGKQAAGCIPFSRDTKRFLVAHRSHLVEQPHTWGTIGGAVDRGETPKDTALRELHEEGGYSGPITMVPLYVFQDKTFRYSNFLAIVVHEFTPRPFQPYPHPGWETDGFRWCEYGEWPHPLHFGLQAVLNDPKSRATFERVLRDATSAPRSPQKSDE